MKKTAALFCGVLALVGCGPPDADGPAGRLSETRQVPSNVTPGIHVTGYATVGVVKRF